MLFFFRMIFFHRERLRFVRGIVTSRLPLYLLWDGEALREIRKGIEDLHIQSQRSEANRFFVLRVDQTDGFTGAAALQGDTIFLLQTLLQLP